MAVNSLGVGTAWTMVPPCRRSTRSKVKEKNVLSLRIGPSISPPNWLRMYLGLGLAARLAKKSEALNERFRLNSYATPWKLLVPDFCTALTSAPAACPYCALILLVSMVNSRTDSSGGVMLYEPSLKLSLLSAPFNI